jgi:sigma-B regulation protein RsbU (phosphoserine phosphatase)
MPLVMEKAKSVMDAEACSILFYNRETDRLEFEVAMGSDDATARALKKTISLEMGQGIAGWVAQHRQPLIIDDVSKDERFFPGADKFTGFTTRNMIAVPLMGRSGLIGVVQIINHGKKDLDPEIFQLLCGQFAIAIENARYYRDSLERERHRQQLEIAAALQKSFLPEEPVFVKGRARVAAVNISASQVGGDVYDFVQPGEGSLGFFIGDVSGKGITAALYMAKFISDFRHVCQESANPALTLGTLNLQAARAPLGMFLTAIYGVLDLANGLLRLAIAGHPPFLHISRGEVRVSDLPSGPPLGIVPCDYPLTALSLVPGDRLLFVTDGVFDAKNQRGERIGFDAIVQFVRAHAGEADIMAKIVTHLEEYATGTDQADDLTLVELCWGERVP